MHQSQYAIAAMVCGCSKRRLAMNSSTIRRIGWACPFLCAIVVGLQAQAQECGDANLIPPANMLDAGDQYGWSIAIDGSVAVVGARLDDDNGFEAGAAYVFRFDGVSWQFEQKLTAILGESFDLFGSDVDVSGDLVVVGAWQNPSTGSGAAYVFRYNNATTLWEQEQKLTAGPAAMNDDFGWSVGIDGDLIAVGARGDDEAALDAGAIHVFRYDSGLDQWVASNKLTTIGAAAGAFVGWTVEVDGEFIVTGCPFETFVSADAGLVHVFNYDDFTKNWNQYFIEAEDPDGDVAGDLFGWSIALDGLQLAVGAPQDDEFGIRAGAVFVYERGPSSNTFSLITKVAAPDAQTENTFGQAIALNDGLLCVAAKKPPTDASTYLYHFEGDVCSTIPRLYDQWDDNGVQNNASTDIAMAAGFGFVLNTYTAFGAGDGIARYSQHGPVLTFPPQTDPDPEWYFGVDHGGQGHECQEEIFSGRDREQAA